jgi:hypothetical protein
MVTPTKKISNYQLIAAKKERPVFKEVSHVAMRNIRRNLFSDIICSETR